jgi:hypothetical protein
VGYRLISYLKPKGEASVFAAYCGIALQETRDPGWFTQLLVDSQSDAPAATDKTTGLQVK